MRRFITVGVPSLQLGDIQLSYSIENIENMQTITCSVDEKRFPVWLQLRKFTLISMKEGSGFVPMFIEVNNSKNMATTLFIDKVYTDIMNAEHFKISASAVC